MMKLTPDPRPAIVAAIPTEAPPDASNPRSAKAGTTSSITSSGGSTSPAANECTTPKTEAPQGTKSTGRHVPSDTHGMGAAGPRSPDPAAGDLPEPMAPTLLDPALYFAADVLDDLERVWIATKNRHRQLTRVKADGDGVVRGFGYDETHPDVARLAALVDALYKLQHQATLDLQRKLRKHPLGAWVKAQRGVGEKQGARLLAAIGDPYIRPEWTRPDGAVVPEGPRTVSALWAYCGLHVLPGGHTRLDAQAASAAGDQCRDTDHEAPDSQLSFVGVAAKRQRNQRSNWNEAARKWAWCVAAKTKQSGFNSKTCTSMANSEDDFAVHSDQCGCGHYRLVYDAARVKYAYAKHETACVRCGPKGRPAEVGSSLSDGHKNARAIRVVMKEILKDLWRLARDWHNAHPDSPRPGQPPQPTEPGVPDQPRPRPLRNEP